MNAPPRNRVRLLDAARALRALARAGGADPRHAASFILATEGRSGQRAFAKFAASASGQRLLRERPPLRRLLGQGRSDPAALPPGSLGRAYDDFMAGHALSFEGLEALGQDPGERAMTEPERWFNERMKMLHDVRHVVAGYGQEPLGELCLLAFRFAQTGHPGMGFFTVTWALKTARARRGEPVISAVLEAYRRGRSAVWTDDLLWEELWPLPLRAVQARLAFAPPAVYDRMSATRPPQADGGGLSGATPTGRVA